LDTLNCSNVMELANEVKEHLNTGKKKFTARPFNRFAPENSVWWITPGSEWPAYKYGKYMFRRDKDIINIGLNIEKGYGKELSGIVSNKAIMNDEWIWHEFMESGLRGKLDKTFGTLVQKNIIDINVFISFGVFNEVKKDTKRFDEVLPNQITYILKENTFKVQNKDQPIIAQEFEILKQAESFQEIFNMISKINKLNYFWIDLFVGVPFKINNNGELDIYKLDNQVLSVLEKWVKGTS